MARVIVDVEVMFEYDPELMEEAKQGVQRAQRNLRAYKTGIMSDSVNRKDAINFWTKCYREWYAIYQEQFKQWNYIRTKRHDH